MLSALIGSVCGVFWSVFFLIMKRPFVIADSRRNAGIGGRRSKSVRDAAPKYGRYIPGAQEEYAALEEECRALFRSERLVPDNIKCVWTRSGHVDGTYLELWVPRDSAYVVRVDIESGWTVEDFKDAVEQAVADVEYFDPIGLTPEEHTVMSQVESAFQAADFVDMGGFSLDDFNLWYSGQTASGVGLEFATLGNDTDGSNYRRSVEFERMHGRGEWMNFAGVSRVLVREDVEASASNGRIVTEFILDNPTNPELRALAGVLAGVLEMEGVLVAELVGKSSALRRVEIYEDVAM